MNEENKSATDLNNKMEIEQKIEQAKTEVLDLQQKIDSSLQLQKDSTILSISDRIDTIPLGGMLEAHDVYAIKIQNKANKIETIIIDSKLQHIATIQENNNIVLSNLTKKRFENLIGKQGKQTLNQKENYDLEGEYLIAEDENGNLVAKTKEELIKMQQEGNRLFNVRKAKTDEKAKNKEEAEKLTKTANIAKALGVTEDQILNIIQIKDRNTKTAISDKDKKDSEIYTVKLKQDSDGRGSNDWVAVEILADRNLPRSCRRR